MGLFDWFKKNKKNSISSFDEIDRENQKHRELERQKRVIKRSGPIMSKDKQSEILAKIKEVADKNGIPYEIELDKAFTDESKSGIDKSHDSELRIDWNETEDVGIITHYNGNPFTGVCFSLHSNGLVSQEDKLVNGLKHGLSKEYHENGQLLFEINYKNDEQHGLEKGYNENGHLVYEVDYKDGKQDTVEKRYHNNGQPFSEDEINEQLPYWFTGEVYEEGGEVRNPLTGDPYELDAAELSMYDLVTGASKLLDMSIGNRNERMEIIEKGESWFIKKNPKAYGVLFSKQEKVKEVKGKSRDESGNEINLVLTPNADIKNQPTEPTAPLNTTFERLKKASENWEDFLLELLDDNGCQIEIFLCDSIFENYEEGTEFSAIEMQIKRFCKDETGEWMEDDETYFPELICAQDKDENYKNYIVYNTPVRTPQLGSGWTNYDRMTIPEAAKLLSSFKFLNYDNICEEEKTNFKYFSSSKLK